jgi:acetyltransferase-like isoleucine patch superfamily enzyme
METMCFVSVDAVVDPSVKMHPFCQICKGASIGRETRLGHNVFVGANVKIGKRCCIQGNVFIPEGLSIHDGVFIGPGTTFCNVKYPPRKRDKKGKREPFATTVVCENAIIGANATILPGITIFPEVTIGAGAVVTRDCVAGLVYAGNPARPLTTTFFSRRRQ